MKISTFVFHCFHLFSISINFQTQNLLYLSLYLFILNSQSYLFLCLSVWICMGLFYTTTPEAHFVITCKCIQAQDKKERNSCRTYTCRVLLGGGQKGLGRQKSVFHQLPILSTDCPCVLPHIIPFLFLQSDRLVHFFTWA